MECWRGVVTWMDASCYGMIGESMSNSLIVRHHVKVKGGMVGCKWVFIFDVFLCWSFKHSHIFTQSHIFKHCKHVPANRNPSALIRTVKPPESSVLPSPLPLPLPLLPPPVPPVPPPDDEVGLLISRLLLSNKVMRGGSLSL